MASIKDVVNTAKKVANNLTASAQRNSPTTRTYSDDGSYTDKDSSGRTVGWGAKGTENLATNGGIMQGSGGSGGGGSSSGYDANSYLNNFQQQINNMYDQQRQAQLEQLRYNRDKSVGQINQQKTETGQQYQGLRNQTDAVSLQNVQRLRESMAANGLTASGENVTAQTNLAAQRQNSLNSLNTQEQQILNDYDRRISDLMDPASENALIAQLEAERARSLLDLGMQADQVAYSRSRDSVMDQRYLDELSYARSRDSLGDQRYDQQWNYQVGRDQVADQRYQNEWDYGVGRDQVMDDRYLNEWEYQKELDRLAEEWRQREWNELSPAERAAAELDFEFYKKKDAYNQANRSSGSGRSSSGGSSGSSGASNSSLSQAYQQYQQQKTASAKQPIDKYYEEMEKIFKPAPYKEPILPIPSPSQNVNLQPWELSRMLRNSY